MHFMLALQEYRRYDVSFVWAVTTTRVDVLFKYLGVEDLQNNTYKWDNVFWCIVNIKCVFKDTNLRAVTK